MADKYLYHDSGNIKEKEAITTSSGAGDAGKIPALDSSGKLDNSMMPVGLGDETKTLTASEALSAGDLVNIWDDTGTAKMRKADASAANAGKRAHGFVLQAVAADAQGTCYLEGTITGLSGLVPGTTYYLSAAAPGAVTDTPPSTSGYCVQEVGVALSATELTFEPQKPIILA